MNKSTPKLKNIVIITEGLFDTTILKTVFKDRFDNLQINFISAGGYSSALSKAKSILSLHDQKVILVLDSDTTNQNAINEKYDFVNSYINLKAYKDSFKFVLAIPEFEIIFLDNPKFLKKVSSMKINESLMTISKEAPRKFIKMITNDERIISQLNKSKNDRDEFFKKGLIKEIYDYISH